MQRKQLVRLLLAVLLILPAGLAQADSTPEAKEWLEKLLTIYQRGPMTVDFSAQLDMSGMGQPMSGSMSGNMTQADPEHSRMGMKFSMANPLDPNGAPFEIKMTTIRDGETVWTEMENPMLGGLQVTKIAIEDLEKVAGAGGGMSPTGMDPIGQLEALSETMDFEVVETASDTVTLLGKITEATRAEMGALAQAPGVEEFIFVLDTKTGFPKEVRSGGEKPFITMSFENLKFLDDDSLPEDTFSYTPPEGVQVMDLGAMIAAQGAQ